MSEGTGLVLGMIIEIIAFVGVIAYIIKRIVDKKSNKDVATVSRKEKLLKLISIVVIILFVLLLVLTAIFGVDFFG